MNWKYNRQALESNPERLLDELEFEYCLPKWFWTSREWTRYTIERSRLRKLIREIKEFERFDDV